MCSPAVCSAGSCRSRCRSDLALDALEMGLWTREHAGHNVCRLRHHSDKGLQYVAVRCTQRLAEAGAVASVGSSGDSYDNALAKALNSLFEAELVGNGGPWTATAGPGRASTTSRSRPLSTSTGSTIAGSTARSA